VKSVADLRLIGYDYLFAKDDLVCLSYQAEGSHCGAPHNGIAPTGRRARWSACGIFRLRDGKITEFCKQWDKLAMWTQLGWPVEECVVSDVRGKLEASYRGCALQRTSAGRLPQQ
jgi:hypothetical protein